MTLSQAIEGAEMLRRINYRHYGRCTHYGMVDDDIDAARILLQLTVQITVEGLMLCQAEHTAAHRKALVN